jgi:mono/diheme cytochrome c family protein
VTPRLRNLLLAGLAAGVAAAAAWEAGLLRPAPRLARTEEAVSRGRAVVAARCLQCHAAIPLAPRVAGWSAERAYDAIGRLPQLRPAMPPFAGSEEERRALAIYLSALGAGAAPPP